MRNKVAKDAREKLISGYPDLDPEGRVGRLIEEMATEIERLQAQINAVSKAIRKSNG